jgi:hypothetical protein
MGLMCHNLSRENERKGGEKYESRSCMWNECG